MADYSREDAAYASRIVERLLNNEAEGLELESDLAVSDVESDAGTFSDELSLYEEFKADVPAVKIADDTVPVSLQTVLGQSERWPLLAIRIASVREFRSNAARPAWHRPSMLTLRQFIRGPQIGTPGCHFTVSTNSSGLRVFWSGAYYVTPNNFNHPTTPTSSVLQSGTFIFGVDGGAYGNSVQWDLNLVVTLPGLPYAHLNF